MHDCVFILLPVWQIMQFDFTDITSSQKDIHQTHTKCQISYDTYWYWCTFSIPLILFLHSINNVCKNYFTWKVTSFSINYYLLNWPLSSIIPNTEIRFIPWVKLKIACHVRKYAKSQIFSHFIPPKILLWCQYKTISENLPKIIP